MVLTMAWATLRIGEATTLRRSDLDPSAGTLRVANTLVEVAGRLHEGPPKTAAGQRTMSLPPSLVTEFIDHLDRFAGDTYRQQRGSVTRAGLAEASLASSRRSSAAVAASRSRLEAHRGRIPRGRRRRPERDRKTSGSQFGGVHLYERYGHLVPEVDKQAGAKLELLRSSVRIS
jgi:hypothetical protein